VGKISSRAIKLLAGNPREGEKLGTVEESFARTGWPKKVSHFRIVKKIVLNPVNEIRFIRQIKV